MVLTYANQLTILRMLFVPCFVILLIYGHPKSATFLFLLAAVTDGLDGLIARKLQQKTVLAERTYNPQQLATRDDSLRHTPSSMA